MPILDRMKRKINPASPICFVQDCFSCAFSRVSLVCSLSVVPLAFLRYVQIVRFLHRGYFLSRCRKGKVQKGAVFYFRCIRKGYLSGQKWYTKGFRPWGGSRGRIIPIQNFDKYPRDFLVLSLWCSRFAP